MTPGPKRLIVAGSKRSGSCTGTGSLYSWLRASPHARILIASAITLGRAGLTDHRTASVSLESARFAPDDPIVVGDASKSELLQTLSDQ